MKKISFLAIAILLAAIFSSTTNAAVPNHFVPKYSYTQDDVDVSYISVWNGLKNGYEFGVFDFNGDPTQGIVLLEGGNSIDGASFIVENNVLKVESGTNAGKELNLGSSPDFSFFIKDSNGNYYVDLNISFLGADMYSFSYGDSGYVEGYDLQAVPIPASFLLLSSAGGLVLIARRNKF